jgi:hypothetical protein
VNSHAAGKETRVSPGDSASPHAPTISLRRPTPPPPHLQHLPPWQAGEPVTPQRQNNGCDSRCVCEGGGVVGDV